MRGMYWYLSYLLDGIPRVSALPLAESLFVLVLCLITIYRRQLSSNDEYRKQPVATAQKKQTNAPLSPRPRGNSTATAMSQSKGSISFSGLSSEILIKFVSYLPTIDIVRLTMVSKLLARELSQDTLWEQLWLETFGDMWRSAPITELRLGRGIYWDPFENCAAPQQGWFLFYIMFEVCWIDWVLAGYNTTERCVVSINGSIYDVTNFMSHHPGSPETLTEGCGRDGTAIFREIGHSAEAESMLKSFCIWNCSNYNTTAGASDRIDRKMREVVPTIRRRCYPTSLVKLASQMNTNKKIISEFALMESRKEIVSASSSRKLLEQSTEILNSTMNLVKSVDIGFGSNMTATSTEPPKKPAKATRLVGKHKMVSAMSGYSLCVSSAEHFCYPNAIYDVMQHEWQVWWGCCGQAQSLVEQEMVE